MRKLAVLLSSLSFSLLLTSCTETRHAAAQPPPPPTASALEAQKPAAPATEVPNAPSAVAEGKPAVGG